MDFIRNRPELSALIAFLIGLALGWFVLGWWLLPVQYVDTQPKDLHPDYKATYIETTAIAYQATANEAIVQNAFRDWPDAAADICATWSKTADATIQAAN